MSKTKYYIAYGSNLSVDSMKHRAPDAKIVGTATLEDWRLLFRTYATIEKSAGFKTPVLIWKISEKDEANLDKYESYPNFYFKENLNVKVKPLNGGEPLEITAMVYIMAEKFNQKRPPSRIYYDILNAGYEMFGFDKNILKDAFSESLEELL